MSCRLYTPPPLPPSSCVPQIFRTGSFVDLMLLLAGGPATGPGPGEAGGPSIHSAPVLVVSKPARQEAGALLSMMATDSKTGPPAVMALSQLLPEALAISIKDSVSAATNAGAGGVKVGTAGLGVGAAGASSGGSGGEAVLVFDGDHESPELIWDATCRHVGMCVVCICALSLTVCACLCADAGTSCVWPWAR